MNQTLKSDTRSIVVEEVFPHAPATVWKALTSGALIGRWLMEPRGFDPVVGNRFTFQTRVAGEWDGVIHCEIIEVVEGERLAYAWKGGHADNEGYGSKLETVVTFTLSPTEAGTRLRLVHSGFEMPRNDVAYRNMCEGWKTVVERLDSVVADEATPKVRH